MAEEAVNPGSALQGIEYQGDEFASLLQEGVQAEDRRRASRRSSRRCARWRSRRWRRRNADRQTTSIASIEAIIAELDKQADRAGQPDPAPRGLPAARRRLARPALSRQQHRDRRDAEDPRHEHLEDGSRQDAQAVQGHGLGPEPALQEGLRGGVRPVRRRALRLPGRRLLLRPQPARRRAARRDGARSPPPRTRPFIAGGSPDADADGLVAGARQPARPDQDLPRRPSTPPGARCASRTTRATSASRCRASSRACPTARRPTRSRSSTSRKTPTAADHSKYTWANAAYAMAVNINRSFKLYGWCSRIRGIESGGAVEGLPAHTFPTDDGGVDMKCPTEIAISDRREAELAKNGFMPLVHRKNTDFAAFIGAQSLQKPRRVRRPRRHRQRQPGGAAAVPVRDAAASRTT